MPLLVAVWNVHSLARLTGTALAAAASSATPHFEPLGVFVKLICKVVATGLVHMEKEALWLVL